MPWIIKDKCVWWFPIQHPETMAATNVYSSKDNALHALDQQLKQLEIEEQPEIAAVNNFSSETLRADFNIDFELRLRKMRLWHWLSALEFRQLSRNYEGMAADNMAAIQIDLGDRNKQTAQYLNERANMHIGYVQTLNDFFPIGDTAEKDAAKEEYDDN